MIEVNEFPPKAYERIRVSLESLYGICLLFPSASLLITFASTKSDLLICPVSPI